MFQRNSRDYKQQIKNKIDGWDNSKRQKKSEDSDKLDKAFEILSKASANVINPEGYNECQLFANLVTKKLAKYSSEFQTNTQ